MKRIAILGYHKIGQHPPHWKSWYYIPEETFMQQMDDLQASGWQVIGLDAFLQGLKNPASLPDRSALLTFDDGYRLIRTIALPLLRRLNLPSVMFIPTDWVGKLNGFDKWEEPDEMLCDWDDLHELDRCGMAIQSHAATHTNFSELGFSEQVAEVRRSKQVLEDRLGNPVTTLAFPRGDDADHKRLRPQLEAVGYKAAFLYRGGPVTLPPENPYRLSRLAMGPDTNLRDALATRRA